MREGSLDAPTRHAIDWRSPWFWDEATLDKEMERVFPHLRHGWPPALLQSVRIHFPAVVRPDRQWPRPARSTAASRSRTTPQVEEGLRTLCDMQASMTNVPLRAAARMECRFSPSNAALPRRARQEGRDRLHRDPARGDRPQRSPGKHCRQCSQLGHRKRAEQDHAWAALERLGGIHITAPACRAMPARPSRSAPVAKACSSTKPLLPMASERPCSTLPVS